MVTLRFLLNSLPKVILCFVDLFLRELNPVISTHPLASDEDDKRMKITASVSWAPLSVSIWVTSFRPVVPRGLTRSNSSTGPKIAAQSKLATFAMWVKEAPFRKLKCLPHK